MTFTVAIIGRPNVGKSTLFNRLTGKQHALVDDQPGVTRDWREGKGRIGSLNFNVIDTAGLEDASKASLEHRMFQQTTRALERADVALFVVDARAGVTPEDEKFGNWLRKSGKPVLLAVNKAEGGKSKSAIIDAYSLGLGEAIAISAAHGEGMSDLFAALEPFEKKQAVEEELPYGDEEEMFDPDAEEEDDGAPLHIAIIGRPNAGKSTLMNQILGEERVLTGPEAGITRDAIAVDFEYKGRKIKLVDTAGMRRKSNIDDKLEKLAVSDALRTIRYAHVVIVLVDAEVALEKQDMTLISLVEREGRALVLGINKWDLITEKNDYMKVTEARVAAVIPQVKGIPLVPISALKNQKVNTLLDAAIAMYSQWNRRFPTGALNRWLEEATSRHSPPIVKNKRIKIRFMTQIKTRPPTIAMFVNNIEQFPDSYMRYLVNGIRENFDLPGVPVRVILKKGVNPYEDKKRR